MIQYSNSLKQRLKNGENLRKIFVYGKISIYSGCMPNREGYKNLTGTLLATGIAKIKSHPSAYAFTFDNTKLNIIRDGIAGYLRFEASNLCWMNISVSERAKEYTLIINSKTLSKEGAVWLQGSVALPVKEYKETKAMSWRDIMGVCKKTKTAEDVSGAFKSGYQEGVKITIKKQELVAEGKKIQERFEREQKIQEKIAKAAKKCLGSEFEPTDYVCTKCNTLHKERTKALECCSTVKEINGLIIDKAEKVRLAIEQVLSDPIINGFDLYGVKKVIKAKVVDFIFEYIVEGRTYVITLNIPFLELKEMVSEIGIENYAITIVGSAKTYEVQKRLLK